MTLFYNLARAQNVGGSSLQDRYYAFTYDGNFDHVLADATIASFVWATGIKTSASAWFTITAASMQTSSDFFDGLENTDIVYGSNGRDAILYNNGAVSGGIGSFASIEQFYLGSGDDIIDLSLHGAGGVDYAKNVLIRGDNGNDTIIAGAGADTIYGDEGDDLIFGYRGADTIYGGAGSDTLYGDDLGFNGIAGDDTLYGQAGDDILYGGARTDRLEGGDGNDTLYGGLGGDTLLGGAGADILYGDDAGTSGNDQLNGEAGNDQLFGGGGNDELRGGSGDDVIQGDDGTDFLIGDSGADRLAGGAGNDTIDGAADSDTVVYSGAAADYTFVINADGSITISDLRTVGSEGTDLVRNVEFFQFADRLVPTGQLNQPPVISSDGGGASAVLSVTENTVAVTTVVATDPDNGQSVTYSIAGGADAAQFRIDTQTGVLVFAVAPNFESPADANDDNQYDVIVRATDNNGAYDEQALAVQVADIIDGFAPVITSNGGGATAAVAVDENQSAVTVVTADDPDGPELTYSIAGGADAAQFTIEAATGVLAFVTAPDFEAPTDANHDNLYAVTVRVSDGDNVDTQALSVSVANLNDNVPVITSNGGGSSAGIAIAENQTLVTTVNAVDADGPPTYAIVGGADAALFAIDAQTGALTFRTAPDFEAPADADGDNVYAVRVEASDGTSADQQDIAITIGNINDNSPVITSGGGNAAFALTVAENQSAVTTVAATDADGTVPLFTIAGGADAALFSLDAQSGVLTFRSAPDFETPADADRNGIYEVTVRASDGLYYDDQQVSVTVSDVFEGGKTIFGSSGNNVISPTATNAAYVTTSLNDTIYGLAGNDTIDGGLGADRMEGGTGNDIFFVDAFSDDGNALNDDVVVEQAGEGTDIVNATVGYVLTVNVENLTLIGAAAIYGTGNELANVITGNDAANLLSGAAGNDTFDGKGGNDTILGGAGDDRLDGGVGADVLDGGADNDTYFVDTYSSDGIAGNDDQVIELAGGGVDIVNATVSYVLAAEVENLTLAGTGAIDGTGNALANTLNGNAAANRLSGLDGDDTINGLAGADVLLGGNGNDTLNGGADNDSLSGEAGTDTLLGGAGDDLIDGGAGTDTLSGQAGADTLVGGQGKDTLTGGSESDTFRFNAGDTTILSTSYDTITDFVTGADRIDLDFVASLLNPSAYAEGAIGTNVFADALNSARSLLTAGVEVAFVAGTTDGWLFWDANRDGTIDQSILLKSLGSLNAFYSGDVL